MTTEEDKNWPFKQSRYLYHPDKSSEEFRRNKERSKKQREASALKEKKLRESDPCGEEADIARQCLFDNYHDQTRCSDETENVRRCKRFWKKVSWARYWKGETPRLPEPEDRDRVFEEYKHLL